MDIYRMTGRQTQQENLSLEQWLWLRIEPSASILRPAILLIFAPRRKDLHGGLQRHGACQSSIHLIGGPGHSASGHRWSAKRVFDCAGSQTHVIAIEFMRIMLSCRFFTSIVICIIYYIRLPAQPWTFRRTTAMRAPLPRFVHGFPMFFISRHAPWVQIYELHQFIHSLFFGNQATGNNFIQHPEDAVHGNIVLFGNPASPVSRDAATFFERYRQEQSAMERAGFSISRS